MLKEGEACFAESDRVFYNPIQEFNRDMSIACIARYQECLGRPISVLEGLSASGLRSIRYAKEIPGVQAVVANDFDESAFHKIKENIKENGLTDVVSANLGDANAVMHTNKGRFDVIDLDPYGSAIPFIDAAVQSIKDGGVLCVTW